MRTYIASDDPRWVYSKAPKKKCLLLSDLGVAFMGPPTGEFMTEYIAWCPLPKRDKQKEKELGIC